MELTTLHANSIETPRARGPLMPVFPRRFSTFEPIPCGAGPPLMRSVVLRDHLLLVTLPLGQLCHETKMGQFRQEPCRH